MKAAKTIAEPLEEQLYSFDELRYHLAKFRGRKLPPGTLREWLNVCCIRTDETGMYGIDDLRLLIRYACWLKRSGTSRGFQAILLKELNQCPSM